MIFFGGAMRCKPRKRGDFQQVLEKSDFPGLYQAADVYSLKNQSRFFVVLRAQLCFLVIATFISFLDSRDPRIAILQSVILIATLLAVGYQFFVKSDRHWYAARAVAESVKTITWRYVTRAEPFSGDEGMARDVLVRRLNDILEQNRDVTKKFSANLHVVQVSSKMQQLRLANFQVRKEGYLSGRVKDQHFWYSDKAEENDCLGRLFFGLLVSFILAAIFFSIFRIYWSEATLWPTEIFVTIASVLLTWIQSRRFSELAAAYTLASFEINTMQINIDEIVSEEKLSAFVGDAENAFSREHTQWVARRDE